MSDKKRTIEVGPILDSDKYPSKLPAADLLRAVFVNGFKHAGRNRMAVPLWVKVRDLTGHGSTISTQLCEYLGLDPHCRVVRRR